MDETLRYHPSVTDDIAAAIDWYDARSIGLGERFRSAVDARFDDILGKIGVRAPLAISDWRLHAFVLTDNDDHLFVLAPQANLSAGMPFLGRVVQLFK